MSIIDLNSFSVIKDIPSVLASLSFEPGEFVVNFGEMLQMWSNNQIKATPHRVKGSKNERISIPLFFNPNYYTDISSENSNLKITAGEYLTKRFNETYTHLQKL